MFYMVGCFVMAACVFSCIFCCEPTIRRMVSFSLYGLRFAPFPGGINSQQVQFTALIWEETSKSKPNWSSWKA